MRTEPDIREADILPDRSPPSGSSGLVGVAAPEAGEASWAPLGPAKLPPRGSIEDVASGSSGGRPVGSEGVDGPDGGRGGIVDVRATVAAGSGARRDGVMNIDCEPSVKRPPSGGPEAEADGGRPGAGDWGADGMPADTGVGGSGAPWADASGPRSDPVNGAGGCARVRAALESSSGGT
jgi:hypothetical protein